MMLHPVLLPKRPARWDFADLPRLWLAALLAALLTGCASLPANVQRPVSTALSAPDGTALGRLVEARRGESRARSDSAFRLLENVEQAFAARLALIDGAERTLDLQYYAIHADASTEQLLQRLRDAAARGVRVRLLLDDLNTVGRDAQVLRLAFEPNIEVRLFNPLAGARGSLIGRLLGSLHDINRLQKRMHNKLFIADNTLGITGGRNLGDAYFGQDATSNFVDLDVLAGGRIVRDMSASFDRYWNNELAYPVSAILSPDDLDALRQPPAGAAGAPGSLDVANAPSAAAPTPTLAPVSLATGGTAVLPDITSTAAVSAVMDLKRVSLTWAPSSLLVDKPGKVGPDDDEVDAGDTLIDGLLGLMAQAQRDMLIVSPYFVPGKPMMARFAELRARGVRIRVLTNSLASNDAPAAHAGYARYRRALLQMGVELHEMRSDQEGSVRGLGSTGFSGSRSGGGVGSGASGGGSGVGSSVRASLHSKAVLLDNRLAVIGSMNLDLRSQLQNSEVALVIRSAALTREAARLIEGTLATGAYRVEVVDGQLVWRAPPGATFADATSEPDASTKLKLLVNLIGPFAPDEML